MLPLEKKSLGKYILSLPITFSLPSQSVLPVSSSPFSCLRIPSFLFPHHFLSVLPSHSVLPISSSPLYCLLIPSFLSPHHLFPVSSSYPYILLPVSSSPLSCLLKLIFLFHHLILSVHSFTYSYSLYPLPFFLYHPFFPVSLSLFPESTSALSCLHFRSSYFFIHFFQTLFPFPIF